MNQQRTLTVVMTDMRGFTERTSQQSRADTLHLVTELRELLVPVLVAHGGQFVKSAGDGFLLTFESPTNAVLAGLTLQDLLQRRNINHPETLPIEVRVAINTGEVTVQDGDVIGEAVNIASRVQEQIEPGSVVLTESTHLSMNSAECACRPIGAKTFRGLPRPIGLFQALPGPAMGRCRPRGAVWIAACLAGIIGVWWSSSAYRSAPPAVPAPEPPAEIPVEGVAEPAPEAPASVDIPVESPPEPAAESTEQVLATIQQTVAGYQSSLEALETETRQASDELFDWSRQLYNLESRATRLSGSLTELTRTIPQVRDRHLTSVQRLIDKANEQEDRGTADLLWRELGQFEASIAQMEAGAAGWAPTIDAANVALRAWDAPISDWSSQLTALQQERRDRMVELANLKTLTAWDGRVDSLGTDVQGLSTRAAELRQAMSGLRAELDGQRPNLDGAEQFLKSWEEFRDQWRAYLYAR